FRKKHGELPATLDALAEQSDKRIAWLIGSARKGGWGRGLGYTLHSGKEGGGQGAKPAFDLLSLGSAGQPRGGGAAPDLAFADQRPLAKDEIPGGGEGLQEQLAESMGLVFQLKAMDHSKPNWRNSDMSVDQVQERLDKAGADSEALFKMLDGS